MRAALIMMGLPVIIADTLSAAAAFVIYAAGEVVRAQIAIGGGLGEDVPDDYDQRVGGGDGRLAASTLAEAAVETAEPGADVAAGAAGGPGALGGHRAEFFAATSMLPWGPGVHPKRTLAYSAPCLFRQRTHPRQPWSPPDIMWTSALERARPAR